MSKPPTLTLTIMLLRSTVTTTTALKSTTGLEQRTVSFDAKNNATLFAQQTLAGEPKWLRRLGAAISPPLSLRNASTAAVLLVPVKGRLFAITFGFGRHLLAPGSWEEGFGLRVTLNCIDASRIRSVDHKTFEAVTRHTRTQTSQQGTAADFGLDVERDLVRAATGEPKDPAHGTRLTGMDALVATTTSTLGGIPKLLETYLDRFQSSDYRQHFGWVDQIAEVRDTALHESLNNELIDRLKDNKLDRLWLSVPEIVEWSEIGGFRYGKREKAPHPDLHVKDFLATVDPTPLTLDILKHRAVYAMDPADENERHEWPLFKCIYFECDRPDSTFLLTGGKWYRIASTFVQAVNQDVAGLVSTTPTLPPYLRTDADEGAYNARVANAYPSRLALMDRKLVRYGGTPIEVCDLFSADKEFIHVKRYGGASAPLSHLAAQATVSATAWAADAEFRTKTCAQLSSVLGPSDPASRPDTAAFTVVFGVVSRSKKPLATSLPFFSRLNLRNAGRQLRALGYQVSLVKIDAS
jgi:uncharacterized protein (TIGR04141 family)